MSSTPSFTSGTSAIPTSVTNVPSAPAAFQANAASINIAGAVRPGAFGPASGIAAFLAYFGTASTESNVDDVEGSADGQHDDHQAIDTGEAMVVGPGPGGANPGGQPPPVIPPVPGQEQNPGPPAQPPAQNGDADEGSASDSDGGPANEENDDDADEEVDEETEQSEDAGQGEQQPPNQTEAPATQTQTQAGSNSAGSDLPVSNPSGDSAGADSAGGSSTTGFQAGGSVFKSPHGGGGFSFGGGSSFSSSIPGMVAGGAVSTILHDVVHGPNSVGFAGGSEHGSEQPPGQVADKYAAWRAAAGAWDRAAAALDNNAWQIGNLREQYDDIDMYCNRAVDQMALIETQMEAQEKVIIANLAEIAHRHTQIAQLESQIQSSTAKIDAWQAARLASQLRALEAGNAIETAREAMAAMTDETLRAEQAEVIVMQQAVITQQQTIRATAEAHSNAVLESIAKGRAGIELLDKIIGMREEENLFAKNKMLEGQAYVHALEEYRDAQNAMSVQTYEAIHALEALRGPWIEALRQAEAVMNALHEFASPHTHPVGYDGEDDVGLINEDNECPADPDMPPLPPGYHLPETGATHTTTTSASTSTTTITASSGTTFVTGEAHAGSHSAADTGTAAHQFGEPLHQDIVVIGLPDAASLL